MRNKLICICASALILSATTALCAVKEGSFSATSMLGGYIFGNDQQLKSSPVVGVRAGYSITKAIGVEALYDYVIPTDSKNWSYAPTGSKYWSLTNISLHRFGGQALYHFVPDNVLVPYLSAGLSGVKLNGSGVNSGIHLAFDYGAGTKYFFTDDIAVRGDIRHILYGYGSTTSNNVEFTLGAYFQFGGIAPVAKAVVAEAEEAPVVEAPEIAASPVPVLVAEPAKVEAAAVPAPTTMTEPVEEPPYVVPDPVPVFIKIVGEYPQVPEPDEVVAVSAPLPVADLKVPVAAVLAKASTPGGDKQCCKKTIKTTVLFDADKVDLKTRYHKRLDEIGSLLKEYPNSKVTIAGHTVTVGNKTTNFEFSQVRAGILRNYIVNKFGIDSSRIITKGFGSAKPVASKKTASGRSKKRSLDVVFNCE